MIEALIVETLEEIETLSGKVFPLAAPSGETLPFCVYVSNGTNEADSLGGYLGSFETEVEINILHSSYESLKYLATEVTERLKDIWQVVKISETGSELYEHEIQAYRKIIKIKLMY